MNEREAVDFVICYNTLLSGIFGIVCTENKYILGTIGIGNDKM
jgi:hypothetical protein